MRLSGQEIQHATQGTWSHALPEAVTSIATDSRNFADGQTFLALRGPHFDGHQFAKNLAHRAQAMIGDAEGMQLWDDLDLPQLQVEDTLIALGDIAHAWRTRLNHTTVIAITGSYGKTTVRSMLAHTFRSVGLKAAETHANLNNLIGVPMTLLNIADDADIAIIECGISEIGEMARLSEIVQPDIAVITGLSSAHGEGLGGQAGIVKEKLEMLSHLLPQGWCALGEGVSEHIERHNHRISHACITMDSGQQGMVHWQLDGNQLLLNTDKETSSIALSLPARHWASNMAFTASIVLKYCGEKTNLSVGLQDITSALATWQPVAGRLQSIKGKNNCTVLDDSYNANPASMQAALDTLSALSGSHIAILGDMAELGQESHQEHAQLKVSGINTLLLIGNEMKALHQQHLHSLWFASVDEAMLWINRHHDVFHADTQVLIKASRSMGLDRLVEHLSEKEIANAV